MRTRVRPGALRPGGAALLGALVMAACAPSRPPFGPLGTPDSPGRLCGHSDAAGFATDGFLALHADRPVTIRSVSLRSPTGLRLVSFTVQPIQNNTLVGLAPGPMKLEATAAEQSFVGDRNLVLGLRRTDSKSGQAAGVEIAYSSLGQKYRWESPVALVVNRPDLPCSRA